MTGCTEVFVGIPGDLWNGSAILIFALGGTDAGGRRLFVR